MTRVTHQVSPFISAGVVLGTQWYKHNLQLAQIILDQIVDLATADII